ncbi:MAG: M28 family peptidase [Spirochaetales bacterium]|nr:M28 family peptidase [Spirochaetales bacterium]
MKQIQAASVDRIRRELEILAEEIGVRLAGSEGEGRAVDFVADRLRTSGARVRVEEFPVRQRSVQSEELEVRIDGAWQRFPCSLFSNTPGTGGQWREAPLCYFEAPAEYARGDLSHLRGRAVVHLGSHIESREQYRRLMDAQPAFLLFVDVRYPGDVPLADGMFPAYTAALGAVPTVNVPYMAAWSWRERGASAARLRVAGGMTEGVSHNVVADLPGREDGGELLILGGHHDTQADSPGADDNATGTVAVLELARLLAPVTPLRRSLRLVSFGAEEQLSVGSAEHVRRHRRELEARGALMLNFDSFGSHLGWFELSAAGPAGMTEHLRERFAERGLYTAVSTAVMPYADHFPFAAAGVPAATLIRWNCKAGRFFHHRPDDDLSRVSPELIGRVIDASAALLVDLAERETLPFPREVPADQAQAAARYWDDLFGGW